VGVKTAPSTERGRAAVQRVLDAASTLFARQGIRATTLDQVGRLSGTGRGQLYLWFAGKSDLVHDVVTQQVQRVLAAQQPLLGSIASAADVREWCALAVAAYEGDDPVRCPIGSLVHELGDDDPAARAALAAGLETWAEHLGAGLRRVRERGELVPAADPEAVATALLAAYQGGVLLASAHGDLAPLRRALDGVIGTALAR
jgi:TetR/AcrR family transcriptional repressor of nem operon